MQPTRGRLKMRNVGGAKIARRFREDNSEAGKVNEKIITSAKVTPEPLSRPRT